MHPLSSLSLRKLVFGLLAGLLCVLPATLALAQTIISGHVTNAQGKPLNGASIYLDNTIDGGTSDSAGFFRFTTTEKGAQTLVASAVGYQNAGQPVVINGDLPDLKLQLRTSSTSLDEVIITAGAFEASNDKDKTVLKPLDIVTTAGANADIIKAIQTLPGTQQQGSQSGLFVRGGDASEAAMVVDGLVVQNAFFSAAPGVATRSRFSPFQFKGISFSSGGYSARYGQALSSVLELNTLDLPEKSTINTGFNMAGIYFSGSKLWGKNQGAEATAYYTNLQPFYGLAKTNFDFYDVPKGGGGSVKYAWKTKKDGLLKVMGNLTYFSSGIGVDNPDSPGQRLNVGIKNLNSYGSVTYRQMLGSKWSIFAGGLYSYNKEDNSWNNLPTPQQDNRAQLRLEARRFVASRFNVLVGTELQHFRYERSFGIWNSNFDETQVAGYAEAEWSPNRWLAFRPGLRYEHSALLNRNSIAPRFSMGIRTGKYSQVSVAGGLFYQNPDINYLLYGYRPGFQEAIHYIANWQYSKDNRTLRLEAYYKDYRELIREYTTTEYNPNTYRFQFADVNNSGSGYAKGLELFWRDKKTVKNLDYWISYSFIDTKREFRNYTAAATPEFISDHNLNVITKYWIDKLQTSVNVSYNYASGRPYYNPSNPEFLGDRTSDFHNLSLTVNYLTHVKKWFTVIYAGMDNVTNHQNIFGYRYSSDGQTRFPVRPALYRSFFVGVNFSLTEFDKDEL